VLHEVNLHCEECQLLEQRQIEAIAAVVVEAGPDYPYYLPISQPMNPSFLDGLGFQMQGES
jgi:hypothetical protein